MEINADFSRPALIHTETEPWVGSPMPGVERRMLDRVGEEVVPSDAIEILVLGGSLTDSDYQAVAGQDGASLWMKTGHLQRIQQPGA